MRPREEYLVKVAPTLEDLPPDHPARIYAAGNVKVDDFIVAPLDDEFLLDSPHYHPINQSVWEVEHALPPYEKITPRPKMTGIYGRWPAAAFLVEDRMCFGAPAVFPYATLQKNGSLLLGACFRHQIMGHRQRCEHQDMVLPVVSTLHNDSANTFRSIRAALLQLPGLRLSLSPAAPALRALDWRSSEPTLSLLSRSPPRATRLQRLLLRLPPSPLVRCRRRSLLLFRQASHRVSP